MDEPKPEWLLVIYVAIAMSFFTLAGFSAGNVMAGVKVGMLISIITTISLGVRIVLDHYKNPFLNEEKQP